MFYSYSHGLVFAGFVVTTTVAVVCCYYKGCEVRTLGGLTSRQLTAAVQGTVLESRGSRLYYY